LEKGKIQKANVQGKGQKEDEHPTSKKEEFTTERTKLTETKFLDAD